MHLITVVEGECDERAFSFAWKSYLSGCESDKSDCTLAATRPPLVPCSSYPFLTFRSRSVSVPVLSTAELPLPILRGSTHWEEHLPPSHEVEAFLVSSALPSASSDKPKA